MSIVIDLSGQSALVTGASQGIGAEIARTLHQAGARVVLNHPDFGDGRTRTDAEAIAADLNRQRPESALVLAADVSNPAAVEAMMAEVQARWGGLDLLVNNAGILRDRSIAKMTLEEWRAVIDTNLSGVFFGCKFGLPLLRDGGAIVNLGSLAATAGFHGQANYAAAKAGVHALTRVLARECAKRSIRVNAVAPGVIDTPLMAAVAPAVREGMVHANPHG
ncbi:MAG: SDR family oxidoreductase, partial [Isosphaeraceae bacterium]|nr:SDR family oxidoreductase [Isosphaeraceae bacterium]